MSDNTLFLNVSVLASLTAILLSQKGTSDIYSTLLGWCTSFSFSLLTAPTTRINIRMQAAPVQACVAEMVPFAGPEAAQAMQKTTTALFKCWIEAMRACFQEHTDAGGQLTPALGAWYTPCKTWGRA